MDRNNLSTTCILVFLFSVLIVAVFLSGCCGTGLLGQQPAQHSSGQGVDSPDGHGVVYRAQGQGTGKSGNFTLKPGDTTFHIKMEGSNRKGCLFLLEPVSQGGAATPIPAIGLYICTEADPSLKDLNVTQTIEHGGTYYLRVNWEGGAWEVTVAQ